MEDENEGAGEGARPQDPAPDGPQDQAGGEGARPQDPQGGEGASVNRHQYERDIERRDKTIGELRAEVERLKGEGGKAAEAMRAVEDLKAQLADERVNAKLAGAGCINAKAAKALLGDYSGDVARLKEACPYLFGQPKTVSTGGDPSRGSSSGQAKTIKEALKLRG